jgi:hypothetical protein
MAATRREDIRWDQAVNGALREHAFAHRVLRQRANHDGQWVPGGHGRGVMDAKRNALSAEIPALQWNFETVERDWPYWLEITDEFFWDAFDV